MTRRNQTIYRDPAGNRLQPDKRRSRPLERSLPRAAKKAARRRRTALRLARTGVPLRSPRVARLLAALAT